MKKVFLFILLSLAAVSLVFAQGNTKTEQQGIHEPGTGLENPELQEAGQGTGQGLQANIESGNYLNPNGEEMQIQNENGLRLRVRDIEAHSALNITPEQDKVQNRTRLKVHLSNGINSEIKIMPNTASETALARLRLKVCSSENNCSIQLKEVETGEQVRAAYEIQAERHARILGIFQAKMQIQAQVDAETGEVIQTKKPWWAFLSTESEE